MWCVSKEGASNYKEHLNDLKALGENTVKLYSAHKERTVVVEGNIGSGKSSFLQYFDQHEDIFVVPEPVELWQNLRGHNLLDYMYKDPKRWALTFQTYVQLTMLSMHSKKSKCPVKLMERSIWSAKHCFVEHLLNENILESAEYAVLCESFDMLMKLHKLDVDLIVYLQASPETCFQRIKHRGRHEEANMSLQYLRHLHNLHEDWLVKCQRFLPPAPVMIINVERNKEELKHEFEKHRAEIMGSVI